MLQILAQLIGTVIYCIWCKQNRQNTRSRLKWAHGLTIIFETFIIIICFVYHKKDSDLLLFDTYVVIILTIFNIGFLVVVSNYEFEYDAIELEDDHVETYIGQTVDEIFKKFDTNGDGELDQEETRALVKSLLKGRGLGEDFEDEQFMDMFEEFDKNGNGVIEKDELKQFIGHLFNGNEA